MMDGSLRDTLLKPDTQVLLKLALYPFFVLFLSASK